MARLSERTLGPPWINSATQVVRQSAIYVLAIGLARLTPFLLVPILTRYLTVAAYGEFELWMATLRFVTIVVSLGSPLYLITNFYQLEQEEIRQSTGSILLLGAGMGVAVTLIAAIALPVIGPASLFSVGAVLALGLTSLGRHVVEVGQAVLQMTRSAGQYLALGAVIPLTAVAVLVLYLLHTGAVDLSAAILSQVIALLMASMMALFLVSRRGLLSTGAMGDLKEIVLFGAPLLPHVLALWSMNYVDRYFILEFTGSEALGLYSAAYTLGLGVVLLHEAAQKVWQPGFFERLADPTEPDRRRIVKLTWLGYAASIIASVLYLGALRFGLPILLGESFASAFVFLPYIVIGYTFHGMYRLLAGYLYLANSTALLALITGASAIANILLNIILIPISGALGAAMATMLSFAGMFLALQLAAARRYPMPWFYFLKRAEGDRA